MPGIPSNDIIKLGNMNYQEGASRDITDFGSYISVFLELCGYHECQIANLVAECLVPHVSQLDMACDSRQSNSIRVVSINLQPVIVRNIFIAADFAFPNSVMLGVDFPNSLQQQIQIAK